jgi:hypothetical protein
MPGNFEQNHLTAPDQSYRDTSQAPQELSLVLYRPADQISSRSRPASPARPTESNDPVREAERPLSPTFTLETENVEDWASRGSVTPRLGNTDLGSPSRASSQGSSPVRGNKGKQRAEQPYSDEERVLGPEEDEDCDMVDPGTDSTPRRPSGQVIYVSSHFCNYGANSE